MPDIIVRHLVAIVLCDAGLQLTMLGLIVWLALRPPLRGVDGRLNNHSRVIKEIRSDLNDLQNRSGTTPKTGDSGRKNLPAFKNSIGQRSPTAQSGGTPVAQRNATAPSEGVPSSPPSTSMLIPAQESGPPPSPADVRPQPRRFYAKSPEADGTFKPGNLQAEAAYDSLYVLIVQPDNSVAFVELHNNPSQFRTALQSPYLYLDPVCSYDRQPQASATSITVLSRGEAWLEGERWHVQRKLHIDFL